MSQQSERTIGIFGIRKSGKTCFLTCLYGRPNQDNIHLNFRDEATIGYLDQRWRAFPPPANLAGTPVPIRFTLSDEINTWNVLMKDYAGAYVQHAIGSKVDEEDLV